MNPVHKYGIIGIADARFLDETLNRVALEFGYRVKFLEIGVAGGGTARGVKAWCDSKMVKLEYHGIDGPVGKPTEPLFDGGAFWQGDSTEVFNSLPSGFNLAFIDGCHCVNHVMLDFLNYSPKVVVGGYVLFHDANPKPTWQGLHYQSHGPKGNPSFCVAVVEALRKLGLQDGLRRDWQFVADEYSEAGHGMALYRRLS